MSVILVTGQPGSGKTALVVDMIAHDEQFAGRPLFVMGIPELTIDHIPCPPVDEWVEIRTSPEDESLSLPYFRFPENSLVVIDEAQRIYRPRASGTKVPPEVAAFETHRHTGVDFILLTQHAGLIDSNIRKLNPRHIHIRVTALGRYKYEWPELGDPESPSSRELASREKYIVPVRAFPLFKSSQLHTKIKTKIPWFVWMFLIAIISAGVLSWYAYNRVTQRLEPVATFSAVPGATAPARTGESKPKETLSTPEYLALRQARINGFASTAPVYDDITKPVDAPWPAACVIVGAWRDKPSRCRCLDQQGNNYQMPDGMCRQIAINGVFKEWGEKPRMPEDRQYGMPGTNRPVPEQPARVADQNPPENPV